ncbi:MAG: enoyl-CoA hydratase/isomerase family protein [Candidatus Heimdallarchaeota archaeon]
MSSYNHLEIIREIKPLPHLCVFLNRPEVHNAFNEELISELTACFTDANKANDIRAVILGGHGRSFCAGADLSWMRKSADFTYEENLEDAEALANLFATIDQSRKPVIGRINGAAIGGGSGLVAACDIAVAVERAKFGFSEINLGIIPAVISPYVLAKIGVANARELFLTGERFPAARAREIGLVQYVVAEEELDKRISELLSALHSSGPQAIAACKELIKTVAPAPKNQVQSYTVQLIAKLRTSEEGKEGIMSFLEKRKPEWLSD